ncbi:MAG TPA: glucose-6-phosphate dehydrogenase [Gemmatimonadales bacterium]|jgi:glucose-6-phosphate 1-dehydrogenase
MTAPITTPVKITGEFPVQRPAMPKPGRCVVVILGGGGDLAHRKLLPALFHLYLDGGLPDEFAIVGVDRASSSSDDAYRELVAAALRETGIDAASLARGWPEFGKRLFYISADLGSADGYAQLRTALEPINQTVPELEGHLFHLALPPSLYLPVIRQLAASGLLPKQRDPAERPWTRVVIEKPFGHDGPSAHALQRGARRVMAEFQLYRIDHYLGKETVQNLLVLRFANSIFETVWNRHYIEQVQITASEAIGVEHRGKYYEEAGIVRDMFQNHLLQLLALTAMEPPTTFASDSVRDEKLKVLRAIHPIEPGAAVRGQYGPGRVDGADVIGYRQEEHVAPHSQTPTYAAVHFNVDNWRWQGVPFLVRAGKRLATSGTEIAIRFRCPPLMLFPAEDGERLEPNVLVARIQPREGISLRFDVKVPGMAMQARSVEMDFAYAEAFGTEEHDAYETLLLDAMLGDQTHFMRSDEVEAAWAIVDPLLAYWEAQPPERFPNYAAGSAGPAAADDLIKHAGGVWRPMGGP